jgi:hypothetical protein
MGHYLFGKGEKLRCIARVPLRAPDGGKLCVGYKTSTYSLFAPVYFSDDGYVLVSIENPSSYYPMPAGRELSELQAAGDLPTPLPAYSIAALDYVLGYVLWVAILATIGLGYVQSILKRRRAASLDTSLPPGARPLVLRTKTDRWLNEEVARLLASRETVLQLAYGYDREDKGVVTKAMYLALTDRRLLVINTRVGAFGPLHENNDVKSYERGAVRVRADERHLHFVLGDGPPLDFYAEWSERHLSNQRRFLSDVPRLLGPPQHDEHATGSAEQVRGWQ